MNENIDGGSDEFPRILSINVTAQTGKKNVALIDKLVLAILKADGYEKSHEWLENHENELKNMKAIDMDFYERAKREQQERGNEYVEYADFLYNSAPTMYQSCLEKIEILGKQLEREGVLYLDFESAKPYYEQKGFIYGDDDEIKEFNDVMAFLYMGRRGNDCYRRWKNIELEINHGKHNEEIKGITEWDSINWGKAISFIDRAIDKHDIPIEGKTGLEIGSRNGGMSLFFARREANCVCTDLKPPGQKAEEKHAKWTVIVSHMQV